MWLSFGGIITWSGGIGLANITIEDSIINKENNYDILRFIAACLVIISHAYPLSGHMGEFFVLFTKGQQSLGDVAVAIFFVISGFLISQSYDRSNNIIHFIAARILRIYPALIVSILFGALLIGPLVTTLGMREYFSSRETYSYLKAMLLFPMQWNLPGVFEYGSDRNTSINGSLWTIPFEVLCYAVVAIIGILKLNKRRNFILFLFCLSFYTLIYLRPYIMGTPKVYWPSFIDLFPFFAAGMIMYYYREKIMISSWYASISFFLLLLSSQFGGFKFVLLFSGTYLIMYFVYHPKIKLHGFSKFGDFSYGLYIYAFPVQQTVTYFFNSKLSPWLNLAISLPITLALAFLSWHIIEKHAMKLKKYFKNKKQIEVIDYPKVEVR